MQRHWIVVIFVSVIILGTFSFSAINAQVQYSIPAWVKGVAGFWAEDKITDSDFGEGLSFLINEGIIKIPEMELLKQRVVELEGEIARFNDDDNGDDTTPFVGCSPDEIMDVTGECVSAFDETGTIAVDLDGTSVDVSYDAGGVEVLSVQSDLEFISLLFQVKVTGSPGILEITLDRNFLDATFEGVDDKFHIITDGFDEPAFEEVETTSDHRTLRIELASGTEELEIFGTAFGEPESAPEEVTEEPETVVEEPEP